MGSSSVLERHFAAAASSNSPEQQPQLRVNDEDGPTDMMPSANTMDDEKSVGLVGATICFTPGSSPVSSPKRATSTSRVNASTSVYSSNDYIGSVHEGPRDNSDSIMESVVSIMKSSAVRIASSLDGRSITEYEVLDGINSRGTIEYEDLISEDGSGVGDHRCARSEESTEVKSNEYRSSNSGSNKSAVLSGHHLSGSIMSCPSLNGGGYDDVTLPTLASPFRDFKSSPSDDEARVVREEEEYSGSLTNSNTDNLSDERDAVVENEERTEGEGSIHSSPVDDRPLNTFMNLQKFWEGHATLSSMTKSMMWRVLGTEASTAEVPEDGKADINAENIAVAAATPSESTGITVGRSSEGNANIASTSPVDPSDPTLEEKLPEPGVNNSSSDDNAHGLQTDSDMGIITKCRNVISTIISATASLCFLVMFVYICNYLTTPGNNVKEEVADLPLIAIPSEEPTYEEIMLVEHSSPSEGYRIVILTVLTLLIGAIMYNYKSGATSTSETMLAPSPNHVAGIWSEEEHRQFLEGYNKHGNRWTQVSTFVPTRSVTQVRAHGNYWLKVRSPTKMTRARVAPTPTNSPDNPMKKVDVEGSSPSSVSSGKSTPTKSNKTSDAKTPVSSNKAEDRSSIKGILTVKDRNRTTKHVTPKTEHKARKSVVKQGPKSDPVRRVRIQAA